MARDARLSILTAQEVDELYRLPRFTEADRRLYFDLSTAELKLVDDVVTLSVAVHLVLQLGYFKAKRQFFVYGLQAVADDLEHILRRHFSARHLSEINPLSKPTRLEQQRAILKLFGYRSCDAGAKKELEEKAQRVAMLSAQPVFILREALQYLAQRRLVAPGYTLPPCPNSATSTLLSFSWLSWHLAPSSTASASHQTREPPPAATASRSSKSTPSEGHHRDCRSSASLLV
jgi:hypothetical protein